MVYTLVSSVVPVVLAGLVVEISISGPCLFDPCRLLNIMESFSLPEDDWWLRLASCSVVSSKSCRFSVVSRRMRFRKSRIIVCLSEGISSPCSSYTGLINSMHVNSSAVDRCSRLHWGQFHLIFWPMTFCMHSWQKVWPQGVIRTGGWKKSEQINGSIFHLIYVLIHINRAYQNILGRKIPLFPNAFHAAQNSYCDISKNTYFLFDDFLFDIRIYYTAYK